MTSTIKYLSLIPENNFRESLKTRSEILTQGFFSETRDQKWCLVDLNEYFDNAVSGKNIESKSNREFLEVPFRKNTSNQTVIAILKANQHLE